MTTRSMRVLSIDDHALFTDLLLLALGAEGYDAQVLSPAEAAGIDEIRRQALALRPDVVLLDLGLGRHDGMLLIRPLTRAGAAVVVVTADTDRSRWGGCLHEGACGVVLKGHPLSELMETVHTVCEHRRITSEADYHALITLWQATCAEDDDHRRRLENLTPREGEILQELMAGRTVHDVAQDALVSEATVRKQVSSVLAKLQVSTQIAAVGLAHRVGWRIPGHASGVGERLSPQLSRPKRAS